MPRWGEKAVNMARHIRSRDNERIKRAVKLASSSAARRQRGAFFASSSKVVRDLLDAGFVPEEIFIRREKADEAERVLKGLDPVTFTVSPAAESKLSDSPTDDGFYAVFRMPERKEEGYLSADRLMVLCDVQDPGNVGAVMRCALALGYDDVILTRGCADIYSPKVIRSSMTASVKLDCYRVTDALRLTESLNAHGFTTVAACLEGAEILGDRELDGPLAVFIGNEGNGLPDEVIARCAARVKIPMSDRIDSLNASVSRRILMWELRKKD